MQHANAIHQLQTDFSKKQTEIAERQLDLNHQIAKHNAKANVVVSMIDEGNGLLLLFENKGMGDAANIYFEPHNNGKSRFIYKPLDHTNGIKLECLPSGARFTHPLQQADSILCQPHIQWVNPDGEEIKKPIDVCRR